MTEPNNEEPNDMDNTNGKEENSDSAFTTENQEQVSAEDLHPLKRKRYHRHSEQQIQAMETFYQNCPHPNDKQRREMSQQLGLDHLQVKFWFQNKRTQNKTYKERHDNVKLRRENEKLRADNQRYHEAIISSSCPSCGNQTDIDETSCEKHQLLLENARLQDEVHHLSAMAEKCVEKMAMRMGNVGIGEYENSRNVSRSSITRLTDADKSRIIKLVVKAMEELITLGQAGEPMWVEGANNGSLFALNLDEYKKTFGKGLWSKPTGFRIEASKETGIVVMNPIDIVEKLMDVNQWSTMFAEIVARAMAHEVTGDFNGSLQLISAELQVVSPLISSRRVVFARYSVKQGDGKWAVVDVSINHIFPNLDVWCRRRPSGCLIEETQNGYSKVTWVEHVEVDDSGHGLFRHLVSTGQALGASRWIATLSRQCERLHSITMATAFPSNEHDGYLIMSNQGKRSLLKLGERMMRSFFGGITTSNADMWSIMSAYADDYVRVLARRGSGDPGSPPGVILCAATSFWVPAPSNIVFDFLIDETNRTTWDVFTMGGSATKLSNIPNGRDRRNCVSLLGCTNADDDKIMIVQESSTDPTASYVVYAPMAEQDIDMVVHGGDSDYIALLPSGLAIFPDGIARGLGGQGGSILTVAIQILVDESTFTRLTASSVATIENLMLTTIRSIKTIFRYSSP